MNGNAYNLKHKNTIGIGTFEELLCTLKTTFNV